MSEPITPPPDPGASELLDRLLGEFVEAIAAGRAVDLAAVAPDRPELRAAIEQTWQLAEKVAVRRPLTRRRIGGFEIVAEIGRGGMGAVFLAEQPALARRVALKILPGRWQSSGRARDRFEREARAVARLRHPSIVPIYEIGEDDGTPWFAMEWVEGRTLAAVLAALRALDRPCESLTGADFAAAAFGAGAPVREPSYVAGIARLVAEIADALAHAHANGVVHRDVKPSNVMVRPDGRALLFDFGLASVESEASLTCSGDFMGTAHYVSPEQAAGDLAQVDAQSDVWSLGATLYELLTLAVPFNGATTPDILRAIQRDAPLAPRKHNPQLPRDLETIGLMALERDRARRYATAADLAADLRRFLEFRPVHARPIGAAQRSVRFVRRHTMATVAVACAFLFVVGTPTALWLQQRGVNARLEKANREALDSLDAANEHNDFVRQMLSAADPGIDGKEVKVVDLLDKARRELTMKYAGRPAVRVSLERTLATCFAGLGQHAAAIELLESVRKWCDERYGRLSSESVTSLLDLCAALVAARREEEARVVAEDALARLAGVKDPDPELVLNVRQTLWSCLQQTGEGASVVAGMRAAFAESREKLGEHHRITWTIAHNLSLALADSGAAEEAATLMRRTLEARRAAFGVTDLDTLMTHATLPQLEKEAGQLDAALRDSEHAVAELRRTLGDDHSLTINTLHNHAGMLMDAERLDEARSAQEIALAANRRLDGDASALTQQFANQLAEILVKLGRFEEALPLAQACYPVLRDSYGADTPPASRARRELVLSLVKLGRAAEAVEFLAADRTEREVAGPLPDRAQRKQFGLELLAAEAAGRRELADEIQAKLAALPQEKPP